MERRPFIALRQFALMQYTSGAAARQRRENPQRSVSTLQRVQGARVRACPKDGSLNRTLNRMQWFSAIFDKVEDKVGQNGCPGTSSSQDNYFMQSSAPQ